MLIGEQDPGSSLSVIVIVVQANSSITSGKVSVGGSQIKVLQSMIPTLR
jgi:hypothetical protein